MLYSPSLLVCSISEFVWGAAAAATIAAARIPVPPYNTLPQTTLVKPTATRQNTRLDTLRVFATHHLHTPRQISPAPLPLVQPARQLRLPLKGCLQIDLFQRNLQITMTGNLSVHITLSHIILSTLKLYLSSIGTFSMTF